jgi:hypothetical protein
MGRFFGFRRRLAEVKGSAHAAVNPVLFPSASFFHFSPKLLPWTLSPRNNTW